MTINNEEIPFEEFTDRLMNALRVGLREMTVKAAANNESLIVGDPDNIFGYRDVPAKQLLKELQAKPDDDMKLENNWQSKSIAALEKNNYTELDLSDLPIIQMIYRYVHTPFSELDVEGLRMLISQAVGLRFVVPFALDLLDKDILAEGDLYEGDLLKALLSIDQKFWTSNNELYIRLQDLINANTRAIEDAGINYKGLIENKK